MSQRSRGRATQAATAPRFARGVYALVRRIPRGRVTTYGQIAAILGYPRAARAVGTALSHLPRPLSRVVPWQRVINASGRISLRGSLGRPDLQRELLEIEGILFRGNTVDLAHYRWAGPQRERHIRLTVETPFDTQRVKRRPRSEKVKRPTR